LDEGEEASALGALSTTTTRAVPAESLVAVASTEPTPADLKCNSAPPDDCPAGITICTISAEKLVLIVTRVGSGAGTSMLKAFLSFTSTRIL